MAVKDMLNTYSTVGNREDLADQVADLFADDVPAFRLARKVKSTSTKHEWTADSLAAASTTPVLEGASLTYLKPGLRTRHQNYTHIRVRNWEVTHTQQAVDAAGVKNQVKRELMKAMKELLRDYDKIILNSANSAVGATATGRVSKGIQKAVVTNTAKGTGAGKSATIGLTENNVNLVLQKVWDQGGDPRVLICGGYQKRVISDNFTAKTGYSFNIEASARMAINNINKYEGSFGTVDVIPDRHHMTKRVTIVDPEHFRVAILRDIQEFVGAKTSSSLKGWVEAEMCLEWGNQKAHGKISFLKTTGVI